MRRKSYRPYIFLCLLFIGVMSAPKSTSDGLRNVMICGLSPCWKKINEFQEKSRLFFSPAGRDKENPQESLLIEALKEENRQLRMQIEQIRQWILNEDRLDEQFARFRELNPTFSEGAFKDFVIRRNRELSQSLEVEMQSIPAQVVFRDPASWSCSLWINVGEQTNRQLHKELVAVNSPVLWKGSLVGIVEYVGRQESRVRLITDSRLHLSVRAIRGKERNRYLLEHLESLLMGLQTQKNAIVQDESFQILIAQLIAVKAILEKSSGDILLAKGEIYGSSQPLWRSRQQQLKGVGFNYDFADAEGGARDLRTGKLYPSMQVGDAIAILQEGDLLVTTGLDRIFPAGLKVALVSQVEQLKEGASSYEIAAIPTSGNLDEIAQVLILPPLMSEKR